MIFFAIAVFLFVLVCIFLCFVVLIQSDKGGGISSAIGGGLAGASNLLGTQDTANLLTRATTVAAILYMGLCMVLSLFLSNPSQREKSLLKDRAEKVQSFSPASVLSGQGLPLGEQAGDADEGALPLQETPPEE
jgi:preprotein translocase subunit SecG